jgi:SAM-dependent methyltransferase
MVVSMADYVLDHHYAGEGPRLALMARLLDPMHRPQIEDLGIGPGGQAVAIDLDLSLVDAGETGVDFRQRDILTGLGACQRGWARVRWRRTGADAPRSGALCSAATRRLLPAPPRLVRRSPAAHPFFDTLLVEPEAFDLVTGRAVLHHIPDVQAAPDNLVASVAPGGAVLLIEPDFVPVTIAEPAGIRAFWDGWMAWSRANGIDYTIGRRLPGMLAAMGHSNVAASAETALYNGGSPWAEYWQQTVVELREQLAGAAAIEPPLIEAFLVHCADQEWWTHTISFTAVHGRRPV